MKRFYYKLLFSLIYVLAFILLPDQINAQSSRINKGLYGGAADDLTFSSYNNRLFAAVQTPGSLFVSSDNGSNWKQAFPNDSLEFSGGTRGWGGGGRQVLANSIGWVALRTQQHGGTLTAAVVSWTGGDSGTYKTLVDGYYFNTYIKPGAGSQNVNAIAISDNWIYVGLGYYITRFMDTTTLRAHTIRLKTDTVWNATGDKTIQSIAVSANSTGYPFYYVTQAGELFKYNGTVVSKITLPGSTTAEYIYTHGKHWGGDTIFLSARQSGTVKIYRSYNAGSSWTEITPGSGTNWPLHDCDYSSSFPSGIQTSSNGLALAFPGGGISYDLGATWTDHLLPDNAMCVKPSDTAIVFGSYGTGVAKSTGGREGTFTKTDNVGLSAIKISHIGTNTWHGVYYVASNGGLGYTTAYFNNAVSAPNKWKAPYGDFPISGVGDDGGVTCVAIDPYDSLHVIAGYSGGFEKTTTGPSGFSNVVPSGWDGGSPNYDANVQAILFVTSSIVLAVTGTGSNALPCSTCTYGNIWRSTDGGSNWTKVTPSNFRQGTCLAKGPYSTSTIYAGQGYYDANYGTVQGNLWKSTDQGATWSYVNSGPESTYDTTTNHPIYDIAVDPRGQDTIWVAAGRNTSYSFAKSTNAGASWSTTSRSGDGAFSSVMITKSDPDIIHVSDRTNLYRYNSILNTSTKTYDGLPGDFIPDLEEGSVLMATYTGLWALSTPDGSISSSWTGTGTWNTSANWSNGIPYDVVDAEITSGNVTISANATANTVTIKAGTSVTLSNGFSLTADTLTIESTSSNTGAFVDQNSSSGFTGYANIGRYLTGGTLGSEDGILHFVSSPVSNFDISGLIDASKGNFNVYQYNSTTPGWERVFAGSSMSSGRGYSVAYNANKNLTFSGSLQCGNYSVGVSGSNNVWNLIGNPYSSPISLTNFLTNNTTIYSTAYFWDQSAAYNASDYASRNSLGGTSSSANGRSPSENLAVGQAFFVQSNGTGSSVTSNNSWRNTTQPSFFVPEDDVLRFKLAVTNPDKAYNEILIGFVKDATEGFDNLYDAFKLNGNQTLSLSMKIIGDTHNFIIQGLPIDLKQKTVPLTLNAGISGNYKFSNVLMEGLENYEIKLFDAHANKTIDILKDSYDVYLDKGVYINRFSLIFNQINTSSDNCISDKNCKNYSIYSLENEMDIYFSKKSNVEQIQIIDMTGKIVYDEKPDESFILKIPTTGLSGVYILNLFGKDYNYTEKIFVQ